MKIWKVFKSEYFWVFLIIIMALGIGISPTIYLWWKTPPGAQYTFAFNYLPDFYHYISWMKSGIEGHLKIYSRYTSEILPTKYVLPYTIYPILGFIGSKIGLGVFAVYTLARIAFGGIRILLIYLLISQLITEKRRRLFTLAITVFLPGFLLPQISNGQLNFSYFLNGITNFDIYKRIVFIPHHTLSHIFNIIFFILFYKGLKQDNKKYTLLAGLSLLITTLINPAALLYMGFIILTAFIILTRQARGRDDKLNHEASIPDIGNLLIHFTIAAIPMLLAGIYYKFYMFTVFPWDLFSQSNIGAQWKKVDMLWTLPEYLGAVGPGFIFSLVTLWGKKYQKNIFYILLLSWAWGPILGFVFFKIFYNSSQLIFRLFQAQQFVPFGIFTGLGIFQICESVKPRLKRIALIGIGSILLIISLPYFILSYKTQIEEINVSNYNVSMPIDTINAAKFLDNNTPTESVVLAGYFMAQILPTLSHNRVYLSVSDVTWDYDKKIALFTRFFSNQMKTEEIKEFFKNGQISYILFGPDTPANAIVSQLDFVKEIYKSGNNYIYRVVE